MKRYTFYVFLILTSLLSAQNTSGQSIILPGEPSTIPAVDYVHFPSKMHAFVWRNWTMVPRSRLAKVLNTSETNIQKIATSMGLPKQKQIDPIWNSSKGYITVLRRNWHLLPYEQLTVLLGISKEELAWRLIEDDFLFVKMGSMKPYREPLSYVEPTSEMQQDARKIASWTREINKFTIPEVPRFRFFDEQNAQSQDVVLEDSQLDIRMIFSYNAEFGDPLIDPQIASYPDHLLKKLSEKGINSVWIHSVLRMLVPEDGIFPGSKDYSIRLNNLKKLVDRAAKYNIKVYLYANEPRAMPEEFFNSPERKSLAGVKEGGLQTLCTSDIRVLDWVRNSYEKVFKEVPGLGGVFTITASENLTNCASHHRQTQCERCKNESYDKIIANINNVISEGVKKGNPNANVLVWDWGWNDGYAEKIINQLSKQSWLMSVSEWSLPIERGGIKSTVGEYSISSVGPGPRALEHWKMAKKAGLKTVAKIQVNASWELGCVPVIPAMELIAKHAKNLSAESINGIMFSWSVGGYPSLNLAIFQSIFNGDNTDLLHYAKQYYGAKPANYICKAWHYFSSGFAEFPYNITTLYSGPQHVGPANLLYIKPTHYKASMVGIPYDDLDSWRSIYPAEVFIEQIKKVSDSFDSGCLELENALRHADKEVLPLIKSDLIRAKAIQLHFASVAAQSTFINERNKYLSANNVTVKKYCLEIMKKSANAEKEIIEAFLPLVLQDPTLGYESSNQYFYVPQDLKEKYINIHHTLEWINTEIENLNKS